MGVGDGAGVGDGDGAGVGAGEGVGVGAGVGAGVGVGVGAGVGVGGGVGVAEGGAFPLAGSEPELPPPHAATARQSAEMTRRRPSNELRIGEFARISSAGQGGVMRCSAFVLLGFDAAVGR